jgi:hypothetical protein
VLSWQINQSLNKLGFQRCLSSVEGTTLEALGRAKCLPERSSGSAWCVVAGEVKYKVGGASKAMVTYMKEID